MGEYKYEYEYNSKLDIQSWNTICIRTLLASQMENTYSHMGKAVRI